MSLPKGIVPNRKYINFKVAVLDRVEGMKSYNKDKMILQFLEMQNEVMIIMSYWIIDKDRDIKDSGHLRINLEYLNDTFKLMNIDEEMVFNL